MRAAQRELYEGGEYAALSALLEPAATALVAAASVGPRDAVLDVAAGDGNVALAAARRGARVVATDLSAVQVRRGEARCASEGAEVEWQVADAELLPFVDGAFDRVLSAFGVVAAPDPEAAAAELFRVCSPGGIVGLTAWPYGSYMAELAAALREAVGDNAVFPEPELGWGDEELTRARLQRHAAEVTITRLSLAWDPVLRGSAGKSDCAAAYFASRVPAESLPRLVEAREAVERRLRTADGRINAEYLLAVARAAAV